MAEPPASMPAFAPEPPPHAPTEAAAHRVEVRALDVRYGARSVLGGLRLSPLVGGQLVAVLGPNGVGKSTLLRALARLVPAQGEVRMDGIDLLACPRAQHLRHVSYLPQTLPQASSLRVVEAVETVLRATCPGLSGSERECRLQRVLTQLQVQALGMQRLDRLSGGQRQMVGLAQVLVRQTPLLLLDEPTSALDLRWQVLALQTLRDLARTQGTIACLAMHDLHLAARFCDRLVLLANSGLVADGTPAEVLRPDLLRRAYHVHVRVERSAAGDCMVVTEGAVTSRE